MFIIVDLQQFLPSLEDLEFNCEERVAYAQGTVDTVDVATPTSVTRMSRLLFVR